MDEAIKEDGKTLDGWRVRSWVDKPKCRHVWAVVPDPAGVERFVCQYCLTQCVVRQSNPRTVKLFKVRHWEYDK